MGNTHKNKHQANQQKLSKSQNKEFFFMLNREKKKLEEVFFLIKLKKQTKEAKELYGLALSYFQDFWHFYQKREYVKAFELENYIWGLLDALAIIKLIEVPKKIQKYFKTDFL